MQSVLPDSSNALSEGVRPELIEPQLLNNGVPEQIIFVDDTEANVVAAKDFGWKASHWMPGMRMTEVVAVHD